MFDLPAGAVQLAVGVQTRIALGGENRYEASVGMINAFDTAPGTARFTGYLPSVSDSLGRQTYVRLGVRF